MNFIIKGCVQRLEEGFHITYGGFLSHLSSFYEEEQEMGAKLREGSVGDREIQQFIIMHSQTERSLNYIKHAFSEETHPSIKDKRDMSILIDDQLMTINLSRKWWEKRLNKNRNPGHLRLFDA